MKVRVSYGTAMELDLENGSSKETPTTAYLMLPGDKCRGACKFCPQAKGQAKWLSRVSWPEFEVEEVKERLQASNLNRICIQSPDIPDYENKLTQLIEKLNDLDKPISLSAPPLDESTLKDLKDQIDRIGVGIDAATNSLRAEKKPSYEPMVFWDYLGNVVEILGEKRATAHIIVGMGEDMGDICTAVSRALSAGADISLFPYKKEEEEVDITYYRRAQLLTSLIKDGLDSKEALSLISEDPEKALNRTNIRMIFQTQGCPDCNRPYYTTSPGTEHKNYPREPDEDEIERIKSDILGEKE